MVEDLKRGDKIITRGGIIGTVERIIDNEKIELRGFGTFSVKHRLPKKARNPKTGDPIFLPERYVPVFKPSKLMKKTVNEKLIEY